MTLIGVLGWISVCLLIACMCWNQKANRKRLESKAQCIDIWRKLYEKENGLHAAAEALVASLQVQLDDKNADLIGCQKPSAPKPVVRKKK